jgi:hypothetical protein
VKSTYELVHKALLIGKNKFHAQPTATQTAPATNIPAVLSIRDFSVRSHCPVNTPIIAVAIAGMVLSNPSGS